MSLSLVASSAAQWVPAGLTGKDISALAVRGTTIIAGTNHCSDGSCTGTGVFRSVDSGAGWTSADTGLTNTDVRALAVSGGAVFAGTYGAGVFRSTDDGARWESASTGLTKPYVYALAADPVVPGRLFAGSYGGVFRSTDDGASWTKVNTGLTDSIVLSLALSGSDLFAGTCCHGVFRSTDDGANWAHADAGLAGTEVLCFTTRDSTIFAGTYGDGIYRSTDRGMTWVAVDSGITIPQKDIRALAATGGGIFAGTDDGVLLSADNGASWDRVDLGILGTHATSFAVDGGDLLAGYLASGLWRRPLAEMVTEVRQVSATIPERLLLEQNFPNPFNPSTTISFTLPSASFVSLKVYTVVGNEAAELIAGVLAPGTYARTWAAGGLPSGVYYYRLVAGRQAATKKLLLLK